MKELGARLQKLRRQAGMSQQELADQLHVSRQSISKWELGTATPDLDNLVRLSKLFGVSLDELVLGRTEKPQETSQQPAPPVEDLKTKRMKWMRLCLIAGVLCLILAFALLPLHQLFDRHMLGNWYTSVWQYLSTVPHNILLIAGAGCLLAAYWNKRA